MIRAKTQLAGKVRRQQQELMSLACESAETPSGAAARGAIKVTKMKMPEALNGKAPTPLSWARPARNCFNFCKHAGEVEKRIFTQGLLPGAAEIWWSGNSEKHAPFKSAL